MSRLVFHKVTKVFSQKKQNDVVAVDKFSLEVKSGELMVLLGPSGCGKTSLLRMVAGLEEITMGDILLNGQSVKTIPPHQRPFSLVFQNYALYPHMTAEQNLTYGLRVRKVDKKKIKRRLQETMELLRLNRSELRRKPAELSGGQRQRIALGRAIMRRPEVFLLDEPMSNLDQKLRLHLRTEMRNIQRSLKATMLLVTHDQSEAAVLGDRITLINKGRIEQIGKPQDLYSRPANMFVAEFMAYPPINLIRGSLTIRGNDLCFEEIGSGSISFKPAGLATALSGSRLPDEIVVGLRPELVSVKKDRQTPDSHRHGCARVLNVEACGLFSCLHMDTGSHRISGMIDSQAIIKTGERLDILIDLSQAVFFDPRSGDKIYPPPPKKNLDAGEIL